MKNQSNSRSELTGKATKGFSQEDIDMEKLARDALAETIRDGGAFAKENPEQFKQ